MTIKELESQILSLTPGDKEHILQTLMRDLANGWPGIEKTPRVVGGDACIVRTRIPVWTLEGYRRLGWSETKILENFPTLRLSDLRQAWGYVAAYSEEIEQALIENETA